MEDQLEMAELGLAQPIRAGGEYHVYRDLYDNRSKQIIEIQVSEDVAMTEKNKSGAAPTSVVGTMRGLTLNMGNFQSARISVWMQQACTKEDTEGTYDEVSQWCSDRLEWERGMARGKVPTAGVLKRLGKTEKQFWEERGAPPTEGGGSEQ